MLTGFTILKNGITAVCSSKELRSASLQRSSAIRALKKQRLPSVDPYFWSRCASCCICCPGCAAGCAPLEAEWIIQGSDSIAFHFGLAGAAPTSNSHKLAAGWRYTALLFATKFLVSKRECFPSVALRVLVNDREWLINLANEWNIQMLAMIVNVFLEIPAYEFLNVFRFLESVLLVFLLLSSLHFWIICCWIFWVTFAEKLI